MSEDYFRREFLNEQQVRQELEARVQELEGALRNLQYSLMERRDDLPIRWADNMIEACEIATGDAFSRTDNICNRLQRTEKALRESCERLRVFDPATANKLERAVLSDTREEE